MPTDPRKSHLIEQYLALSLEVQAQLARHKQALIDAGWTEAEAWALCQRVEERMLGPVMDAASAEVRAERIAELVRAETCRCAAGHGIIVTVWTVDDPR